MTTKKDNAELSFYARFAQAQLEYCPLYRDTKGYGYNYATLTQVIEVTQKALISNQIYYQQTVENNVLRTYLIDLITGERQLACEFELVSASVKGANELQQMGAGISYLRRYSLMLALGLATEDNDAKDVTIPVAKPKLDAKDVNELNRIKAEIHKIIIDNADNTQVTDAIINWANTNVINNQSCTLKIAIGCLSRLKGLCKK